MSVQVRRRREAAAFLSTYVGAQGELLVDTTNNRVQVHDGATSGGFPAAAVGDLAGRNTIVNGNLSVNQRAFASGTALAAGAYAHDRWKAGSSGCTYTFTQTVPDTLVTITAGTLIQAIDAPNVYATTFWVTWLGTAQARVWQGSATGSYSAGTTTKVGGIVVNALLVSGLVLGTVASLEFTTGTLGLVQVEAALPNAGPTRFERRHGELALCMRYFRKIGGSGVAPYYKFGFGFANTSTLIPLGLIGFYVPMRATPSVAATGGFTMNGSNTIGVSSIAFDQGDPNGVSLLITVSGSASGFYLMQANGDATASILLSAEL